MKVIYLENHELKRRNCDYIKMYSTDKIALGYNDVNNDQIDPLFREIILPPGSVILQIV